MHMLIFLRNIEFSSMVINCLHSFIFSESNGQSEMPLLSVCYNRRRRACCGGKCNIQNQFTTHSCIIKEDDFIKQISVANPSESV